MGLFKKKEENRDNPTTTPNYEQTLYSSLGLPFFEGYSQRRAMNLSAVYRCVELISDNVAMLPIRVREDNVVVKNHPLYNVLNNRDNLLNKYNLMKLLIQSVLLRGNGFAYINRNSDGSVKSLRFVESGDVTIHYDKVKRELYYFIPSISNKKIEPINVIHLLKNSYDGINGISVITYADDCLSVSKAAETSAKGYYDSGCNLSGVLSVQGQLNGTQRQDIIQNWKTAYSSNGGGVAVLQGNMSYTPIQVSAKESQLIEAREYNTKDIARFFGVNPALLGESTGGAYANLQDLQQAFVLHTLMPYIVMVEQEFSRKLLKGTEQNFHIDLNENFLLRADKSATANYYTAMVNNGLITRNEARNEIGYSEVEGGDTLTIAFSNVSTNTIGETNKEK